MTVEEAYSFFEAIPKIKRKLKALIDVGLSYITLGQSALTFSGGEAQRIKLAKELSKVSTKNTLYILDEPTTGLHFHDVKQLLDMLMRLRDDGNTVIIIEHNLDVIKCADYLIDLGPEGGSGGGQIIATGTPEQVAQNANSFTGQFLKPILQKAGRLLPPTEAQPSKAAQPTAAQPAEASQPQEAKKATRKGTKKSASAKKASSSTKSKAKD